MAKEHVKEKLRAFKNYLMERLRYLRRMSAHKRISQSPRRNVTLMSLARQLIGSSLSGLDAVKIVVIFLFGILQYLPKKGIQFTP